MSKTQVLKIQISLASSDGAQKVLTYNKDKSFLKEEPLDPKDVSLATLRSWSPWGEHKMFVHAEVQGDDVHVIRYATDVENTW